MSRGIEADILPAARELGIGVVAYGVLSRGLLSGRWAKEQKTSGPDFRAHLPRFRGDNLDKNLALVDALRRIVGEKGVSVAQLATAWVLSQEDDIIALVGARTRDRLKEALGAIELKLSEDDLRRIEEAVPPNAIAGDRYDANQMAMLDSEK